MNGHILWSAFIGSFIAALMRPMWRSVARRLGITQAHVTNFFFCACFAAFGVLLVYAIATNL